jgi:hypothetical protein
MLTDSVKTLSNSVDFTKVASAIVLILFAALQETLSLQQKHLSKSFSMNRI